MVRVLLTIYSWLLLIMGILGLIPGLNIGTEPVWHALVKIILGIVGIWVSMAKKKEG
ncbi:hypothetical protein [Candidatus Caldatribacterium saccharofermentans]|uniref:hypothetical protein n=1 Tax=Candidatus Caldatribacterium saccharofermentans TaxID=1454753 RepID=UPI00036A2C41